MKIDNKRNKRKWGKNKKGALVGKGAAFLVACLIYAAGISFFLDPNNLAPGGLTGISIMINRFSGIKTGTLLFLLNIPLMIIGWVKFGFRLFIKTLSAIFFISFFTNSLGKFVALTKDPFLACIAGSSMVAIGIGVIFRLGGTTGGTDIVVKLLRQHFPHLKTGSLFLMIDLFIVAVSGFVFRNLDTALYAAVAVMVCSYVMDMVLYGRDEVTLLYVISREYPLISKRLMEEMGVGVTLLHGKGGYQEKEKEVIMCVVKKTKTGIAEKIIKNEDPYAFMIITSASEIYGEGYKDFNADKI